MQLGFYFDQSRCIGCFTCVVACKDWHNVEAGPASWRRVKAIERGKFPEVFVAFLSIACCHCAEPACVLACPADAITKREEDGIVVVNPEKCQGQDRCDLCLQACPYEAPQFSGEDNAKMQMCDLCLDRWAEGKKPVCVDSCPMRALDAGPMDDLRGKYGDVKKEATGFVYAAQIKPSVIFKPRIEGAEKKNLSR